MKRLSLAGIFFILISLSVNSQTTLSVIHELKQRNFHSTIKAGNYSGITCIGGNRYAVVDDKSQTDGFYIFNIDIDSVSGKIKSAVTNGFFTNGHANRDGEGIVYVPVTNTIFISGEKDNEILEYNLDGSFTGRSLQVPSVFNNASSNYGFEALAYNHFTHLFWTTTESTIPVDGVQSTSTNGVRNKLRIQSFDENLKPQNQYAYMMDAPLAKSMSYKYAFGVSEMTALDDGRLIVLEREFYVPKKKIGAFVNCKLFIVDPAKSATISDADSLTNDSPFMKKTMLYKFKTSLSLFKFGIANYEGMCLGPVLTNGDRTLILISDSQNQYKGILKDWFKVLVISSK